MFTTRDEALWRIFPRNQTYAEAEMAPDEANHKLSEYTMDEILYPVPRAFGLREFGERAVICLLPDRVREAML
jgi:hypothetical protein